jgi:hypothetical protein
MLAMPGTRAALVRKILTYFDPLESRGHARFGAAN